MGISIIKMRRSWDRFRHVMRIPLLLRRYLHIFTPPVYSAMIWIITKLWAKYQRGWNIFHFYSVKIWQFVNCRVCVYWPSNNVGTKHGVIGAHGCQQLAGSLHECPVNLESLWKYVQLVCKRILKGLGNKRIITFITRCTAEPPGAPFINMV